MDGYGTPIGQPGASMIIILIIPVSEADNTRDGEVKVELAGLPLR